MEAINFFLAIVALLFFIILYCKIWTMANHTRDIRAILQEIRNQKKENTTDLSPHEEPQTPELKGNTRTVWIVLIILMVAAFFTMLFLNNLND
jgi:type VI protein secretion system component VasF